jgi:hypothetical protein
LSDDDKKIDPAEELKKRLGVASANGPPLPGIGNKTSNAPLPGPDAKGGLPLPGLGSKPANVALPGLGESPSVTPPFMTPSEAPQPVNEEIERDPFGKAPARARPSFAPGAGEIGASRDSLDPTVLAAASNSKRQTLIGGVLIGIVAIIVGYMSGSAVSGRVELNIAIRDARIVEWETKKAARLFDDVQTVVNSALVKASKRVFDSAHLDYLAANVKGNPIPAQVFTQRNYKKFDPAAVQFLNGYYNKWDKLNGLIQVHKRKTNNDKEILSASKEAFEKLLSTNYGAVFNRDKAQNKFLSNVVVLGNVSNRDGKTFVKVQAATGTLGDDRELLNPSEDASPTKSGSDLFAQPDKYVVEISGQSKNGLLKNATVSHFESYAMRLKEISDLMKGMTEEKQNLLNKLASIASQEPVGILAGGVDVEDEVEEYIEQRASSDAPAAEPAE